MLGGTKLTGCEQIQETLHHGVYSSHIGIGRRRKKLSKTSWASFNIFLFLSVSYRVR